MKKIFISLIAFVFLGFEAPLFAIQWFNVVTPRGRSAYIDLDSIKEFNNHYFYNIKVQNEKNQDFSVITIQSSKNSPLSAKLRKYTEAEYLQLNGDYENITKNYKTLLEPVTYDSVVNTCYKKVKHVMEMASLSEIVLDLDE